LMASRVAAGNNLLRATGTQGEEPSPTSVDHPGKNVSQLFE
jgi:hypothetical protein